LNLPAQTSAIPIEKQASLLDAKLTYSDFQDPAKVKALLKSFTAKYDVANSTASNAPAVQLMSNGTPSAMSTDLLTSIQSLKR
jgi:hypothetical protein